MSTRGMANKARFFDFPGIAWAFLLFLLLPNVFFSTLAFFAGVGRPYLNLDYGMPIFLMLAGLRKIGALVFLLCMSVDLLLITGQVFPVLRLGDILYLSKFFLLSSGSYQLIALLVVVLVLLKCLALYKLSTKVNERFAATILGALVLLFLLDVRAGPTDQPPDLWKLSSNYPIASQLQNFLDYRGSKFLENIEQDGEPFEPLPPDASAVSAWSALQGEEGPADRLLLIIVESWGVPHRPEIQEALLRPLRNLAGARFEQGVLPFDGATVGGELRELCQLAPNHFNLAPVLYGFENCLPNRLKAQGYRTLAMHGSVSRMYDRRDWYPRAGFDENIFFESRSWPARCYSFPGACDLDMLAEVAAYFSAEGKRFLYWLTLNSHSMYDIRDIRVDAFDCREFSITIDSRACRHLKLQAQFFDGLGRLLSDKTMRGVHVLLIGDHSPLMIESQDHKAMFESGQVPWLGIANN